MEFSQCSECLSLSCRARQFTLATAMRPNPGRSGSPSAILLAVVRAADPIGSGSRREQVTLPAQSDDFPVEQLIDRFMDKRHGQMPVCRIVASDLTRHFARTYRCCRRAFGKQGQYCSVGDADRHLRFRPEVMRSGFGGGFQSGGGIGRCRLDPSPMAPGFWRTSPDVSASAASAASDPPRIRLMRSRIRRASSKSRACAAASISR